MKSIRIHLLVAGMCTLAIIPYPSSADVVLVDGEPPLTQEIANGLSDFFEWLLEAQMTEEERQQLGQHLVDSWKQDNEEEIQSTLGFIGLEEELAEVSEDERALVRIGLQRDVLAGLKEQQDPIAQMLVRIYGAAHPAIAQGTPPLIRQVSDAYAEVLSFALNEVAGQDVFVASKEFLDEWAGLLAAAYESFSAEEQEQMASLPQEVAALRVAWSTMSESEKAALRDEWRAQLAELEILDPAGQDQTLAAAADDCHASPVICDMVARAEADRAAREPFLRRAEQMSCDELMALPDEANRVLTVNLRFRLISCYDDKAAREDAQYPPEVRAQRQLARQRQKAALISNISSMQHGASMILGNTSYGGTRYEYRPKD